MNTDPCTNALGFFMRPKDDRRLTSRIAAVPLEKPLSPSVKKVEHNVLMHIKRDVRHTGKGWLPLMLDTAWENALKRLVKSGIIVERSDLGGYVPIEFAHKMIQENLAMLDYLNTKYAQTEIPVKVAHVTRDQMAALKRLVVAGFVSYDAQSGYTPLVK